VLEHERAVIDDESERGLARGEIGDGAIASLDVAVEARPAASSSMARSAVKRARQRSTG
jgi:hypothetical protein